MQVHASCAARDGDGVLLLGPAGVGKSDLLLRLIMRGFELVADDRVEVDQGGASPPAELAGLLEVRGLGIVRLAYVAPVRLALAVRLSSEEARDRPCRLPFPKLDPEFDLPVLTLNGAASSAPDRVAMALDCALGRISQVVGMFAA